MNEQHTQGRVYARQDGSAEHKNIAHLIESEAGALLAYGQLSEADARRFVACWNAFTGVPTEVIESCAGQAPAAATDSSATIVEKIVEAIAAGQRRRAETPLVPVGNMAVEFPPRAIGGPDRLAQMQARVHPGNDVLLALSSILDGEVGRDTLAKLATGQGTQTQDGKDWLAAKRIVDALNGVAGAGRPGRGAQLQQAACACACGADPDTQRKRFEESYAAAAMPCESDWFRLDDEGEYFYSNTADAWKGWRLCVTCGQYEAARARMSGCQESTTDAQRTVQIAFDLDVDAERSEFCAYEGLAEGATWSTRHIGAFVYWLAAIRSVVRRSRAAGGDGEASRRAAGKEKIGAGEPDLEPMRKRFEAAALGADEAVGRYDDGRYVGPTNDLWRGWQLCAGQAATAAVRDGALLDYLDAWVRRNKDEGYAWFTFAFDTQTSAREQIGVDLKSALAAADGDAPASEPIVGGETK